MVLVGGSPKFIATDDFPWGLILDVVQPFLTGLLQSYSTVFGAFLETIFPEPGTNYVREWGFKMSQKTPAEIAANSLTNLGLADLRPLLSKIDIPTLILHGEKDTNVFTNVSEGAKYMHENIQGSKNYLFEGRGHFPSITAPDKFNKILKEFITTGKLLKD